MSEMEDRFTQSRNLRHDHPAQASLRAPLQMPTLRIELEGIKQAMMVAITAGQRDLHEAIQTQLTECLKTLTPNEIIYAVRRSFDDAVHDAVQKMAPELVERGVHEYFTKGAGADIIREALFKKINGY
jgi:hypothetical protein